MSRGLGRETTPAGLDKQRRKWLPAQRFCVSADVITAECSSDSTPGIDWDEAVDFAFASIELDERTCGIVVSVLEELVERRRNLSVNTGRLTDQPEPQVAPAWIVVSSRPSGFSLSQGRRSVQSRYVPARLSIRPIIRRPCSESNPDSKAGHAC